MRLLIIEDERHLSEALCHVLKGQHYAVDAVYDGASGIDWALTGVYDVILLDWMLPKQDGIAVLKALRSAGLKTPILMLTAKGEVYDKVTGLDSGADDYLPKPFDTTELLARVRALSRRQFDLMDQNALTYGDLVLNAETMQLTCGAKSLKLTLREKDVLALLIQRKGMLTSKELMLERLWGFDSDAEDNHVEVYISFLRKKLAHLKSRVGIVTTRGVGYGLEEGNRHV